MIRYTIKHIADLAGVSRRTLHFYNEKGLLMPSSVGNNGYRYYDDDSLLRLQQILFYREIGLDLQLIKKILNDPEFDMITTLQSHRQMLGDKIARLQTLIQTIDTTLMYWIGEIDMDKKSIFEGFSDEKQKEYEQEAVDRWGDRAAQSIKLWKSYSDERKQQVLQDGSEIYLGIADNMEKGADSPEIQALLVRWHEHLRNFYEPTIDVLENLGNMYQDHPDFNTTISKIHPDLPAFLKIAIGIYVDNLKAK